MSRNRQNDAYPDNSEISWDDLIELAHMGKGVSFNKLLLMVAASSQPTAQLIVSHINATNKFIDATALDYLKFHNDENITPTAYVIECLNELAKSIRQLEKANGSVNLPEAQHKALTEIDLLCRVRITERLYSLGQHHDRFFKIYRNEQNELLPLIETEHNFTLK